MYYKQLACGSYKALNNALDRIDGAPMGYPLSPVLTSRFLGYYVKYHGPSVHFYRRYVDDTFSVFSTENEALSFFGFLTHNIVILSIL